MEIAGVLRVWGYGDLTFISECESLEETNQSSNWEWFTQDDESIWEEGYQVRDPASNFNLPRLKLIVS